MWQQQYTKVWVAKCALRFFDIIQNNVATVRSALPFEGHNKQSVMSLNC